MFKISRPIALLSRWAMAGAALDVVPATTRGQTHPGTSRGQTLKKTPAAPRLSTDRRRRRVETAGIQHTLERDAGRLQSAPWLC